MKNDELRILIVCSKNSGKIAPFIVEQADFLKKANCTIDFFTIEGKGFLGYLKNRKNLLRKISDFQPIIIHAHYGFSGLLANLQRRVPVVTTYHGSDINNKKALRFSKISIFLSKFNIFVSKKNIEIAKPKKNYALLPCGVDLDIFYPLNNKNEIRQKMGLDISKKYILFSSSFDNVVKNIDLAKKVIKKFENVILWELKNYSRRQVSELMNAVDCALLTSFSEGSPQFVKEAMACNCPVVSVDVGDVGEKLENVTNSYVSTTYDADEIAACLQKVFTANKPSNGREKIIELKLDNKQIINELLNIYNRVINF